MRTAIRQLGCDRRRICRTTPLPVASASVRAAAHAEFAGAPGAGCTDPVSARSNGPKQPSPTVGGRRGHRASTGATERRRPVGNGSRGAHPHRGDRPTAKLRSAQAAVHCRDDRPRAHHRAQSATRSTTRSCHAASGARGDSIRRQRRILRHLRPRPATVRVRRSYGMCHRYPAPRMDRHLIARRMSRGAICYRFRLLRGDFFGDLP